jgi:hypothetical protein
MKPGQTIYKKTGASNLDIRKLIDRMIPIAVEQTKSIAEQFKGTNEKHSAQKVWNFLKYKINYLEDDGNQVVKSPSALMREKVGDCKSYAVFTSGILTNLGIDHSLVYTSYTNDPTPSHVYVITGNGIIIDAVWSKFNSEKKPKHKYFRMIKKSKPMTGIDAQSVLPFALGLGMLYFITTKK